jgi:hypothetical protein
MLLVKKHQQRRVTVVALFNLTLVKTNSGEKEHQLRRLRVVAVFIIQFLKTNSGKKIETESRCLVF